MNFRVKRKTIVMVVRVAMTRQLMALATVLLCASLYGGAVFLVIFAP
jgi:hypothetical protein